MSNITLTPVKKNSVITLTPVKKPKLNLQSPDYELTTAISGQPKYKEQIQDFIDKPFISLNKPDVPIIKPTINLQLPTQEMEQAIQPPQPYKKESKAKDVVDAFRLGFVDLYNKGKMYVTTALPQFAEYAQQPEVAQPMFKDDNERKIFQEELGAKYKQQKLEYQKWITNHPELQPRPEYEGSVIENLKKNPSLAKDPFYWGYIISSNAPIKTHTHLIKNKLILFSNTILYI